MSEQTLPQAELEHTCLQRGAWVLLLIGLMWLLDIAFIETGFAAGLKAMPADWPYTAFIAVFATVMVALMLGCIYAGVKYFALSDRKIFWTQNFTDEWTLHLTLKAYRITATVLIFMLLAGLALTEFTATSNWLHSFGVQNLAQAMLAAASTAFAVPVLLGLRES